MSTPENAVPEFPSWGSTMKAGHWYRISGDSPDLGLPATRVGTRYLEDNDPAVDPTLNPPKTMKERARRLAGRDWLAPWSGRMRFPSITEAWNGEVFASRFGRSGSMVHFGGGHDDYFGSDVHAFDLESREWRRLTTGFIAGGFDDYGEGAVYPDAVYPDGSALPPHTYDYVQYDEAENDFILLKGQTELGPKVKSASIPHIFNLDTLSWRHGCRHQSAILNSGGFTTWDAKRRVIWGHAGDDGGGNAFVAFCPDGQNPDGTVGAWGALHPSKLPGEANHNAMQIDPVSDRILVALHKRDSLACIGPARPANPVVPVVSEGEKPRLQEFAALEYSEGLDAFVYFSAVDGAAVYAIEWNENARWRRLNEAVSLDPVADAASTSCHRVNKSHTFGRFRVAHYQDADLAVLVRHVDSPVYAMRISL